MAKALRESEINQDVHATRPGLAKILRMCTYMSAFNKKKVKKGEKCVMRYVDEKKVSLCPRNDEDVCVWHAYALVKPKAGGGRRDFEFANYPAFLIVARD